MQILTAATGEQVEAVLSILVSIAKTVLGCLADVVNVVMENPLLLIPIGITMLYTIINVFKRLF